MTRFERWLVWSASFGTGVTGLVYLWMQYALEPVGPWAVINHPLQPLVLKLHILVSPVLVFALGTIALRHVWRHFRGNASGGRRSGVTTGLVAVGMVVSGYLVQVLTAETWLRVVAWAHIVTGLLFTVGLIGHQLAVRRVVSGDAVGLGGQPARGKPRTPAPASR